MGKKNVHKLSSDLGQSFILLGISSHENDYRLSWAFNEYLGLHFVKDKNYEVFNSKINENQSFTLFTYTDSVSDVTYRLISNRCPNGFFIEEFKNIDFLLLLYLQDDHFQVPEFVSRLKAVPLISAAFQIDIHKVKGKYKFI